jgi:hypothetical protein
MADPNVQRNTRRVIFLIVGLCMGLVVVLLLGAGALVLTVFKLLDNSDSHRCAMAYLQTNPAAIALLGTPIEQRGFTGGRTSTTNGDTTEDITFNVGGSLAEAAIKAKGERSSFTSHLEVLLGQNGHSQTIYSGPFDCPALHAKPH